MTLQTQLQQAGSMQAEIKDIQDSNFRQMFHFLTGAKIPLQRVIRPKINAPHLNVPTFFWVKARKYLKVYPETIHQDQYFGG